MKTPHIVRPFLAAALLCANAWAQTPGGGAQQFAREGLSFAYPAGWTLADKSNPQAQHLVLTRPDISALVMVIVYRDVLQSSDYLRAAREQITKSFAVNVARQMGRTEQPLPLDEKCLEVAGRQAVGYLLRGQLDKRAGTGEVYSLALGRRFVNLVHIRADADEAEGAKAWRAVLDSLKVEPPPGSTAESGQLEDSVAGGKLNKKAVKRVAPRYPPEALASRTQGSVVVQLTVDEKGDVVAAQALNGPTQLQGAAERAAQFWKFTPTTLCGRPVKVNGTITINFELR